jgi:hypothetical protein
LAHLWGARINVTQLNISDSSLNDLVLLNSEGSNKLALRNGTDAQEFRLYETYTSSTNYERLAVYHASNETRIETQDGSGGASALALGTDSTIHLKISPTGLTTLPTSDPGVAGALWRSGNDLKISTG